MESRESLSSVYLVTPAKVGKWGWGGKSEADVVYSCGLWLRFL